MKRVLAILLFFVLTLSFVSVGNANPSVLLDGKSVSFDVPPEIENGRTMVPLRAIFEALGAEVNWDNSTSTAIATKDNTIVKLGTDGRAYINGKPVTLDMPAKEVFGRILVPLRFVSEAFGCQVYWDETSQIASIITLISSDSLPKDLFTAVRNNNIAEVRRILSMKVNPNVYNDAGYTPLIDAAGSGYKDVSMALLLSGANPNLKEKQTGATAIIVASMQGYPDIVKLLLDYGADQSIRTDFNASASDLASKQGHREIVEILKTYAGKATAAPGQKDIKDIVKKNINSVVQVVADTNSQGSGFFFSNNGAVVTNYHVISGAKKIYIKTSSNETLGAIVGYASKELDLALIVTDRQITSIPVAYGNSDEVELGDSVLSIGNPMGMENTISTGIISGLRNISGVKIIQTTTPISPGSSGGPLLNMNGDVIGVTFASVQGGQNLNLAIPINYVKYVFEQALKKAK